MNIIKNPFKLYISAIFLYLLCTNLFSKTDTPPDSTKSLRFEMEAMRVVASSESESIGKISKIYIAENLQAEQLNLSSLLKNVPGASISTGSRGESNLRIRGFKRENVKIMIDGREVNGGYFGYVNLSELPIFDVSEVQMVKGAVSALYGANSSGGVVNFISRKPDDQSWLTLKQSVKRNATFTSQVITAHDFDSWD
ncbi:MAG: TonB-dependent receptor plug domain-containing protein, partial [Candidatus Cloacimonetes bacterium]|nr:TonB-dependent receptor plug domain-containing protein [Candidatus Cloacimonadota bacterium]